MTDSREQKNAGITRSKDKDGKVNLSEKVTVYGTGKYGTQQGKAYEVHPIAAERLIKKSAVVDKEAKPK